jgi:hypothetical protein
MQLVLFQSTPADPRWEQLPAEVRQQTTRLLAQLLNEYAEREMVLTSTPEVRDE